MELPLHIRQLTAEFKTAMQQLYGERLAGVVLYGSYARGDYTEDSDVDLLVVLRGLESPSKEHERTFDTCWAMSQQYQIDVSAHFVGEERYRTSNERLFFMNIKRDGVAV